MLAEDAIKSAISNYYTKNPKSRATDLSNATATLSKVDAVDAPPVQQQQQIAAA